jgi:hypothetical protein
MNTVAEKLKNAHAGGSLVDKGLAKALVTIVVALAFGLGSLRYKVGTFADAGPGLFPLMISALLLLMGLIGLWQAWRVPGGPIDFKFRGFAIIAISFCGFALLSQFVNMIVGTIFMVFTAGMAGPSFSWSKSLKIAVVLVAVAIFMRQVLGLELPLY